MSPTLLTFFVCRKCKLLASLEAKNKLWDMCCKSLFDDFSKHMTLRLKKLTIQKHIRREGSFRKGFYEPKNTQHTSVFFQPLLS